MSGKTLNSISSPLFHAGDFALFHEDFLCPGSHHHLAAICRDGFGISLGQLAKATLAENPAVAKEHVLERSD